jgi:protein phosphatase PTC7
MSTRTSLSASARYTSSPLPRPYRFHIGASWAGKPPEPGSKRQHVPFASDSAVGAWRDKTLSRPKTVFSKDAGEDFFYMQEVSLQPHA